MRDVRIGLLGCGNVGRGFVELLRRAESLVAARTGVAPRIVRVAVRDAARPRPFPRELLVDAGAVVTDPEVDVVVELIGGIEPARSLVLRAIERGKCVVTANKALLARHGGEIFDAARRGGVRVAFEASVCGGLPVLRALTQGLVANRVDRLWGIVSGTCNFVLTAMEDGATAEGALAAAQACGLTEIDASLDLDGVDALQKLQILAGLAFGGGVDTSGIPVDGIRGVARDDLAAARSEGFVLRHIAQADRSGDGLWLAVGPALLAEDHPLASARDEHTGVFIRGDAVGDVVFTGRGAGPLATASAVLADVVDVATTPAPVFAPATELSAPARAADRRCAFRVRLAGGADAAEPLRHAVAAFTRAGLPVLRAGRVPRRGGGASAWIALDACSERAVHAVAADLTDSPGSTGPPLVLPVLAAAGARERQARGLKLEARGSCKRRLLPSSFLEP